MAYHNPTCGCAECGNYGQVYNPTAIHNQSCGCAQCGNYVQRSSGVSSTYNSLTGKVRIYELARELKLESRKIIDDARRMGVDVSVPSNTLDDPIANKIREMYFPAKKEIPASLSSIEKPSTSANLLTSNKKENISKRKKQLILKLESIIGGSCYNSNIQNYGPGGEWEGEGRGFRYPLTFIDEKGQKLKYKGHSYYQITETMLKNGYYAFGANELHIMDALERILTLFEKEYGMNFENDEDAQ